MYEQHALIWSSKEGSPPSSTGRTEKTARQTELSESDKKKIEAMQRPSDMEPGDS